jgi:RND family efflux transporter MFP subunit
MSIRGRKIFWILPILILVIGGGTFLYTQGMLPGAGGTEVALADTTGTADDPETGAEATEEGELLDENGKKIKPVPVELCLVENRGIAAYYRAASVIEADRLVELVSRIQGRVSILNVEEGDWVEKGRILAELENDRERIQLRKAELTLGDKERLRDRNARMLEEELISQQEYDDVESAWHLAKAERDLAEIALEETRIRAPFSGQVTERMIVEGQQLAAASPAFTVGDFSPLRVRVHLPEAIARKVEPNQRVLVTPEAADKPLEAIVERVSPVVDPATSTVRLTLLLADGEKVAQVGGFVKVRITTEEHADALAIPKLALVEEGSLRSVFVAEADTVRKVEIETGLYDESHIEILEGLFSGDYVVTMGQGGLRTGTHIDALNGGAVGYADPPKPEDKIDPAAEPETVTALANPE